MVDSNSEHGAGKSKPQINYTAAIEKIFIALDATLTIAILDTPTGEARNKMTTAHLLVKEALRCLST